VAVDSQFVINYASENVSAFLPTQAADLLGKKVSELENLLLQQEDQTGFISQLLLLGRHTKSFETINPYKVVIDNSDYNLILSQTGNYFLLEFEPDSTATEVDIHKTIGRSVSEMLAGKQLKQLLDNAAQQVKQLIGYDRIMIYKFIDDGHGEVISEVKEDHLEPFLGLHYPATDIPKQARELYKKNLTRIITDVDAESSPILGLAAGIQAPALDLTCSALRAVSPIHVQYLKNMGVASSFSISLMYREELWGLIACHNYSPRFINYKAREASKLIGQIISSALEYKQDEANTQKNDQFKAAYNELSDILRKGGDIGEAITQHETNILSVTDATGAVLVYEDKMIVLGQTPEKTDLEGLVNWL
jgi:light-regulated signal transduction histidine kinase (bacteriophytochrome)